MCGQYGFSIDEQEIRRIVREVEQNGAEVKTGEGWKSQTCPGGMGSAKSLAQGACHQREGGNSLPETHVPGAFVRAAVPGAVQRVLRVDP